MRPPKLEWYQGSDGQFYWRLKSANGKTVCQGEGHPTKAKAIRAARRVCVLMYAIIENTYYGSCDENIGGLLVEVTEAKE